MASGRMGVLDMLPVSAVLGALANVIRIIIITPNYQATFPVPSSHIPPAKSDAIQ
jgi:hypothetical protein